FTTTALDAAPLDWKYFNGTRTAPTVGATSGTVTFTMPSTAGAYNVRFFVNNSLTRLLVSSPITVPTTTGSPTVPVTPTTVHGGRHDDRHPDHRGRWRHRVGHGLERPWQRERLGRGDSGRRPRCRLRRLAVSERPEDAARQRRDECVTDRDDAGDGGQLCPEA